jgi:ATP-binding cassette subfamily C protein CydD
MRLARQLLARLPAAHRALGLTLLLGVLTAVVIIGQAHILSQIIDRVFLQGDDLAGVRGLLILFVALAVSRFGLIWTQQISAQRLASLVKDDLRERLARHLLALGPGFTRQEESGELSNSLTAGVEKLDAYLTQYLPQIYLAVLMPLTLLVLIFPLDWLSGLILLATAPLIPLFMFLVGTMADELVERQWGQLSLMSAHFLDVLQGLKTLKVFNRSRAQIDVVRRISTELGSTTLKVLRVAFLSTLVMELAATLSTALIAGEIGVRVLFGGMTYQAALFVLVLTPEFYLPLRLLGVRYHLGKEGAEAAQRLLSILTTPVNNPMPARIPLPAETASRLPVIHFDDVTLIYPQSNPGGGERAAALHGVTLTLRPGETTALIGASGAGKSSLVNLLLGFVEPSAGQIRVGDQPLSALDPAAWRARIGWVSQQPHLSYGTIADNLRLARPDARDEELVAAAQQASAHDFIQQLPQGYDTHLGDLGQRLSGGQRQRIALARAFLKDAPLLILDEPTANLDGSNEAAIMDALHRLMAGRTVLLIAHRLNTLDRAHRIVLLDHGRVLAQGTDAALRQNPQAQLYRDLVAAFRGEESRP